jgi:beta-glucosidase
MLEYDIDQWGYTYMYYGRGTGGNVARQAEKPMYPFGYGLSYTTFDLTPGPSPKEMGDANGNNGQWSTTNVQCSIKNTGTRKGAEVVQVYASFPGSSVSHRPTRKLVGFERVELEPGETKTVTIPVREKELAYYDETTHTWQVEGGTVKLSIGSSSDDERLSTTITTTAHKLADTYLSDSGTGINNVNVNGNDNVNGNNVQSSTIYDLNGTAVGTANDLQSLPKGIYILNGQKQTN